MTKSKLSHFNIESASHPGMTRTQNEDRYRTTTFLFGDKQIPSILSVLCDGIGGHNAGEVAAEIGVSVITETITASELDDPLEIIQSAVSKASQIIHQTAASNEKYKGMGATCAIIWLIGNRLYTANLGDSRIYLLRQGHIVQLTTDHTWIQEALDAGVISGDNVDENPNAHVIRRYLGSKRPPLPDFRLWYFEGEKDEDAIRNQGMKIRAGDLLLACSDGLTDLVMDKEILEIIQTNPLPEVPEILIALANQRGGFDNTTMIIIQSPVKKRLIPINTKKEGWVAGCFGAGIFLVTLLAAIVLGVCFFNGMVEDEVTPTPTRTRITPSDQENTLENTSVTATSIPNGSEMISTEIIAPEYTITPWPTHTQGH